MPTCTHLDQIRVLEVPAEISGCEGEWSSCYEDEVAFVLRGPA